MKSEKKKWILRILLTLSTAAFVCWIFSNSLKTAAESTVQSSFVKELVENFFNALVPGRDIEISEHVIRKLAHFCEYALMGFLLFFTYLSYTRRKLWFFIPSLVGIVIPFCDEGLQFFSDGRAPSFGDVGIDISGAAFGFLCAWAVYFVVLSILRAGRRKHSKDKDSF